jgi:hypothetical protein
MKAGGPLEDIVERCLTRLAAGESLDAVLRSHPQDAGALRAILEPAHAFAHAPVPPARPAAASLALNRMLSEVQAAATQPHPRNAVLAWLRSLTARPLAYQALAGAAAVAIFGGISFGAAAATGSTPAPVRRILRISSSSERRTTLSGSIASIEGSTLRLIPDAADGAGLRSIIITPSTRITRGDARIALDGLHAGDAVTVDGALRDDDTVEARTVRAKEVLSPVRAASPPPGVPSGAGAPAPTTPGALTDATPEHDGTRTGGPGAPRTPSPDGTPAPGEDRGGEDSHGAVPGTTATPTSEHPGSPEPTEPPEATQQPEPTEKPESTQQPEPTHPPDPTQRPEATEPADRTETPG